MDLSYLFFKLMLSLSYAVTEFLLFICSEDFFLLCFYVLSMSAALHVTVCPFFFICEMIRLQSHHDDDLKDRSDVFVFFNFDCMQIFFFCKMLYFQVLLSTVVF